MMESVIPLQPVLVFNSYECPFCEFRAHASAWELSGEMLAAMIDLDHAAADRVVKGNQP